MACNPPIRGWRLVWGPSMSGFTSNLPLPKVRPKKIRAALLHVISLAHYSLLTARGYAADAINPRVQLQAEIDRLEQEVALLREELRNKDARMERIDPRRRPHYAPTERLAILTLKAARGWSQAQAARAFLLEAATIASWLKKVRENGEKALVQLPEPVNRFPDFVRAAVQRLKALCPSLGKVKIADLLARAGLHLAPSTVRRMIQEPPVKPPPAPVPTARPESSGKVTAKRVNHVHHSDLTTVPTSFGFWICWLPFTLPPFWPFCW